MRTKDLKSRAKVAELGSGESGSGAVGSHSRMGLDFGLGLSGMVPEFHFGIE